MKHLGRFSAAVECGQRWYLPRCWFGMAYPATRYHPRQRRHLPKVRRLENGIAIGPLMFWKDLNEDKGRN